MNQIVKLRSTALFHSCFYNIQLQHPTYDLVWYLLEITREQSLPVFLDRGEESGQHSTNWKMWGIVGSI